MVLAFYTEFRQISAQGSGSEIQDRLQYLPSSLQNLSSSLYYLSSLVETSSQKLVIFAMYSMSSSIYEKICREFSESKIAFLEKTAGLRVCSRKILQFEG